MLRSQHHFHCLPNSVLRSMAWLDEEAEFLESYDGAYGALII